MLGLFKVRVMFEELFRFSAGYFQYTNIGELCHLEVGQAALARAKELAGTSELQVFFRQLEAIVNGFDNFQPLLTHV